MKDLIRIGEFAKLNNLSIQTLRYYESIGLLRPYYINSETNYRYYHLLQSPIVDSIQFLKSCDLSLNDIKQLLSESTPENEIHDKLSNQLENLKKMQHKIQQQIKMTEAFLENDDIYQQQKKQQTFGYHWFSTRHLYTYTIDKNIYDLSSLEYEWYLRQFKQSFTKNKLENLQFSHVGSIVKQIDVIQNHLFSNTFFVFCPADLKSHPNVITLKKSEFAIDYCHSFEDEKKAFYDFKEKVSSSNKRINGDYLCEVIRELPHSTKLERNMTIRMQIPVSD